jgi:hypothetical protein
VNELDKEIQVQCWDVYWKIDMEAQRIILAVVVAYYYVLYLCLKTKPDLTPEEFIRFVDSKGIEIVEATYAYLQDEKYTKAELAKLRLLLHDAVNKTGRGVVVCFDEAQTLLSQLQGMIPFGNRGLQMSNYKDQDKKYVSSIDFEKKGLNNGTSAWSSLMHVAEELLPTQLLVTGTALGLESAAKASPGFLQKGTIRTLGSHLHPLKEEDVEKALSHYFDLKYLRKNESTKELLNELVSSLTGLIQNFPLICNIGRAIIVYTFIREFVRSCMSRGGVTNHQEINDCLWRQVVSILN